MYLKLMAACGLACALAGCSNTRIFDNRSNEQKVAVRAVERWEALIKGDYKKAYSYLSAGYQETQSEESYQPGGGRVQWDSIKPGTISCVKDVCNAVVFLDYTFRARSVGNISSTKRLEEKWILSRGRWSYLPKN